MLRAYQLSSSANRSPNESSSPWTLKDRNDNQDTSVRTRTVSTRILGLGIVLVGVLALAVGLIMGLEFPKYVYEKNKEAQCVLHVDHENYRSWQSGSQWKRIVKVYYWIITNKDDFLYRKEKPEFIQRGPYVYIETEEKYDIRFAVTEVSFRKRIKYTYDSALTTSECARCREWDRITILNEWYLHRIFAKGGEKQLVWEYIPKFVAVSLSDQGLASLDGDSTSVLGFNQNISVLGDFNSQTMVTSSPLANVSFGTWFNINLDGFPQVTRFINGSTQFTNSEVLAIYSVFTNSTLLYGSLYSVDVDVKDVENSLHVKCEEWADWLCSAHTRSRPDTGVGVSECGVVYILHKCHENSYDSSEVSTHLHSVFCPNSYVCLNLSSMPEEVAFEYRRILSLFLVELTSKVYVYVLLPSNYYDLVMSHNQSSLALGFQIDSNKVVSSYYAKGLLYQNRQSNQDTLWKFYTCLKNRDMKNNMKVKEYNGWQQVPNGIFTHQPSRSTSLTSYTEFSRPCSKLQACVDCDSSEQHVDVFVEDLIRPVVFSHKDKSSIDGVRVVHYEISNTTFVNTSTNPSVAGVQDVTPVLGMLAWVGPPNMDAFHGYLAPTQSEPSFVQVEPVTGRMWTKNIKLQWNIGVSEKSSQAWDRSISGDFVSVPLPITWYQRVMTISDDELDEYQRLVIRLMNAACGGLIAFSVIAAIIAIIGAIICIYPFKPNKVIPVFDESLNNNNVSNRH